MPRSRHPKKASDEAIDASGGEPLLDLKRLTSISKAIKQFCKEKTIKYTSSAISNGYYLTKEIAKKLKEECAVNNAQISIDGLAPTYSRQKGTSEESFYKVLSNIKEASEYIRLDIRVNITEKNLSDVIPLFHVLFDDGVKNVTAYLAIVRDYNGVNVDGLLGFLEYEKNKRRILEQLVKEGF